MNYGYKVTKQGRELLAACLATGEELEFTRVAVGSGRGAEDVDLADMTDLIHYVADGTIAQRRHLDNVLYLTVQYASNYTPGLGAFYLAEFIVQARHPVSGEDVTLLYATLGDYIQPVNAYSETQAPDIRQYPLALAISDEINVTISVPAGLVTYDDLDEAVEKACQEIIDEIATGGIKKSIDFSIPANAWVLDEQTGGKYKYYFDLTDAEITRNMIPMVVITEEDLETAFVCGFSATASASTGFVRMKCTERPTAAINATCHLLVKGDTGGGGGSYVLPVATTTTLGGIKASDSVVVEEDGTARAYADVKPEDMATNEEVAEVIEDIFGPEE